MDLTKQTVYSGLSETNAQILSVFFREKVMIVLRLAMLKDKFVEDQNTSVILNTVTEPLFSASFLADTWASYCISSVLLDTYCTER